MATETTASPPAPSAQVVGNAFVEQYYHILHHSPELVYRFYQDSSVLSRPDPNGTMTSVTSMKSINDKICSLDYTNFKAEIKTADAQESYKDGVVVLVTGCLTGRDNLRRKFTQTFFLAPQDKGYFVLNDVFRYVDENEPDTTSRTTDMIGQSQSASLIPDPEQAQVLESPNVDHTTSSAEEVQNVQEQANIPVDEERQVGYEREIAAETESLDETHISSVTVSATSAHEDAPKKSYASILSSQSKKGPTKIYVPTNVARAPPPRPEKQPVNSVGQVSLREVSPSTELSTGTVPESKDGMDEVEGHSIYIRNLPLNVTAAELEVEFKKFGPIKHGGVQVRSNRRQGFCFGFVEFEDLSSMHSAIQASPITVGGRPAAVEIKRTTTRVGSSRGRFPSGRGGFRNDNFRGRGNFTGGRGYGRNDFGNRGDYAGRGRGQAGRGNEGYQQGRGRSNRRGGPSQNAGQ